VAGAYTGGVIGFAKGVGVGMLGGVAHAVGKTAGGVAQVGRGIYMSPFAASARREEKVWDQDTGSWVDVDLRAEEKSLEAASPDEEEEPSVSESREVKETDYYDFLGVKPGASQSSLKEAYKKLALVYHPDKGGDTQKFQKLSEVYHVLGDPDSRQTYDRDGADGLVSFENGVKMDPRVFFSLLFGSENFVPWIGELHIAMQAADILKAQEKGDEEGERGGISTKKRQQRRHVRCAVHLRDKLDGLVYEREEESWFKQMRMEARQMAIDGGEFGPALLSTLGEMYQVRSELYLANRLTGWLSLRKLKASVKQRLMNMKQMASLYSNTAFSARSALKIHGTTKAGDKEKKKGDIEGKGFDEEVQAFLANRPSVFDEHLPTFLETTWAYGYRRDCEDSCLEASARQVGTLGNPHTPRRGPQPPGPDLR